MINDSFNERQQFILQILENGEVLAISQIFQTIKKDFTKSVAQITVNRDIKELVKKGFLEKRGGGRTTAYQLSAYYHFLRPIDSRIYFEQEEDERAINDRFNFSIFEILQNPFTKKEREILKKWHEIHQNNLKTFSPAGLKKEFERLVIEFSWKSSKIEGNTYSLLETEHLIVTREEAKGHSKEEARMIFGHKNVLEYIRNNTGDFQKLSVSKIIDIHRLLTEELKIQKGLRKHPVRIVGTRYKPLDNEFQIREALGKACEWVNRENDFFTQAFLIIALIAYIQPFGDGNKRTSRMIGNAVLLANKSCPLSYRSVNEVEYKKAMILFYEQNNISLFKKLFLEQFEFAVNNYFS